MKWGSILGIIAVVVLMTLMEWPRISQTKEKIAFIALTAIGFALSLLILNFPDLPGPNQMIQTICKPLGQFLEK